MTTQYAQAFAGLMCPGHITRESDAAYLDMNALISCRYLICLMGSFHRSLEMGQTV